MCQGFDIVMEVYAIYKSLFLIKKSSKKTVSWRLYLLIYLLNYYCLYLFVMLYCRPSIVYLQNLISYSASVVQFSYSKQLLPCLIFQKVYNSIFKNTYETSSSICCNVARANALKASIKKIMPLRYKFLLL